MEVVSHLLIVISVGRLMGETPCENCHLDSHIYLPLMLSKVIMAHISHASLGKTRRNSMAVSHMMLLSIKYGMVERADGSSKSNLKPHEAQRDT